MLIGELSKKTGLSRDTIRFYERLGLLAISPTQRRANNFKEYPVDIYIKILLIKDLKGFGFTLNEIKSIIFSWHSGVFDCELEKNKVVSRVAVIDQKIHQLMVMKNNLLKSVQNCPEDCDIVRSLSRTTSHS